MKPTKKIVTFTIENVRPGLIYLKEEGTSYDNFFESEERLGVAILRAMLSHPEIAYTVRHKVKGE